MAKCDRCGYESLELSIAEVCPKCHELVGWPVPGVHASAAELAGYDAGETDKGLMIEIKKIAARNLSTLMRRKRQAEARVGLAPEQGHPPNAEPEAAAADPSVQPQPDGGEDAEHQRETAPSDAGGGSG